MTDTDAAAQFYDERKAHELLKSLALEHPDWDLLNLLSFGLKTKGAYIIAVSNSLYKDLQVTAESSGGSSTNIIAMMTDIASRAVDEKSEQIGPALESTVDLVIDDNPRAPVRVLIEKVAPDAAIMRYHPSQ